MSYCLSFGLVALLGFSGAAFAAPGWAIQAFTFGSEAQAEAVVTQLRGVGFDAYRATLDGSENVRIGCFSNQKDADALVKDVQQRVALDARVVPFRPGDGAIVCVTRQLGFIPPASWGIETSSSAAVTFWLEAGGRRSLTFDGESWQLEQGDDPLAALEPFDDAPLASLLEPRTPEGLSVRFRATQSRGLPLIRADFAGGSLVIAAGRLLWASPRAAVVQEGSDVFALRLYRP